MVTKSLQDRWIDEGFMTSTVDQSIACSCSLERCSYLTLLMLLLINNLIYSHDK